MEVTMSLANSLIVYKFVTGYQAYNGETILLLYIDSTTDKVNSHRQIIHKLLEVSR